MAKLDGKHIGGKEYGDNAGVRVRLYGNEKTAKGLVNIGKLVLGDLKRRMILGDIKFGQDRKKLRDGSVIKAVSILGEDGMPDNDEILICSTGIGGSEIVKFDCYCSGPALDTAYPGASTLPGTRYGDFANGLDTYWTFHDPYQTTGDVLISWADGVTGGPWSFPVFNSVYNQSGNGRNIDHFTVNSRGDFNLSSGMTGKKAFSTSGALFYQDYSPKKGSAYDLPWMCRFSIHSPSFNLDAELYSKFVENVNNQEVVDVYWGDSATNEQDKNLSVGSTSFDGEWHIITMGGHSIYPVINSDISSNYEMLLKFTLLTGDDVEISVKTKVDFNSGLNISDNNVPYWAVPCDVVVAVNLQRAIVKIYRFDNPTANPFFGLSSTFTNEAQHGFNSIFRGRVPDLYNFEFISAYSQYIEKEINILEEAGPTHNCDRF